MQSRDIYIQLKQYIITLLFFWKIYINHRHWKKKKYQSQTLETQNMTQEPAVIIQSKVNR